MLEQGLVIAEVIRKWYPTICYELCILEAMPRVRIGYESPAPLGLFELSPWRTTLFAQPPAARVRGSYLLTLAHETRHAWHYVYKQPATEADCNDFARDFLKRYRRGPTLPPYEYAIEREPFRCTKGHLSLDWRCKICESEDQRRKQVARANERERLSQERQLVREAKALRRAEAERRSMGERVRQMIDHHPHNGKSGWWCIDQNIWVEAASAGEAVIRAAELLEHRLPESIDYLGTRPPPQVRPLVRGRAVM